MTATREEKPSARRAGRAHPVVQAAERRTAVRRQIAVRHRRQRVSVSRPKGSAPQSEQSLGSCTCTMCWIRRHQPWSRLCVASLGGARRHACGWWSSDHFSNQE